MNNYVSNPLVSLTVAVYNVEKYLNKCLESILMQSYKNWECIIVNDGSTDDSEFIAKRFCEKDHRFRLINKINGGLSSARNVGLEHANGVFMYFIDGDDSILSDCIEYCVNNIGNSDILCCGCISVNENDKKLSQANQGEERHLTQGNGLVELFSRTVLTSVWSKFYRLNKIKTIKFNEKLKAAEDLYFNAQLLLTHPDILIKVVNYPIYQYRIVNSSLSHAMGGGEKRELRNRSKKWDFYMKCIKMSFTNCA